LAHAISGYALSVNVGVKNPILLFPSLRLLVDTQCKYHGVIAEIYVIPVTPTFHTFLT